MAMVVMATGPATEEEAVEASAVVAVSTSFVNKVYFK